MNPHILHIDSIIFKTALALFVAFTFSPFLVLLVTLLIPGRKSEEDVRALQDRLGTGHTPKKVAVIIVATSLLLWELVSSTRLETAINPAGTDMSCIGTGYPGGNNLADIFYGFSTLVRSRRLFPCLYGWSESCADADSGPCRYYSKPAFYIFLPGFELIILGMYAVTRVDRMFYALGRHEQLPLESRGEYEMN
jgi:hypothetical protein